MKFTFVLVLFVGCSVDMGRDVITGKSRRSTSGRDSTCYYTCDRFPLPTAGFCAPCSWYNVGDSVNYWYRVAQQDNKVESQDNAQQPHAKSQ